jgi:hypothetical protein
MRVLVQVAAGVVVNRLAMYLLLILVVSVALVLRD